MSLPGGRDAFADDVSWTFHRALLSLRHLSTAPLAHESDAEAGGNAAFVESVSRLATRVVVGETLREADVDMAGETQRGDKQ